MVLEEIRMNCVAAGAEFWPGEAVAAFGTARFGKAAEVIAAQGAGDVFGVGLPRW